MTTDSRPRLGALAFAERARRIAGHQSPEAALQQIVALALESVDCEYASVTLVHNDGTLETVASSHPVVDQADALQYELSEGPCLTAAETNGLYVIPETATDPRWPNWGPRAAKLGLHSILSVHLFTDRQVLGALNLYARPSYQYTSDDIEACINLFMNILPQLPALKHVIISFLEVFQHDTSSYLFHSSVQSHDANAWWDFAKRKYRGFLEQLELKLSQSLRGFRISHEVEVRYLLWGKLWNLCTEDDWIKWSENVPMPSSAWRITVGAVSVIVSKA